MPQTYQHSLNIRLVIPLFQAIAVSQSESRKKSKAYFVLLPTYIIFVPDFIVMKRTKCVTNNKLDININLNE